MDVHYFSLVYDMMEYYKEVNGRHQIYIQRQKDIEERDYESLKGLKVKIVRNDEGKIISYESNHLYDR